MLALLTCGLMGLLAIFGMAGSAQAAPARPALVGPSDKQIGQTIVNLAKDMLGVTEYPYGSNRGRKIDALTNGNDYMKGQPWCAAFTSKMVHDAYAKFGLASPLTGGRKSGVGLPDWSLVGTLANESWAKHHDRWHSRSSGWKPSPGSLVTFNLDGETHIGLVQHVSGGTLVTIEGNRGNAVRQKTYVGYRHDGRIRGFIDVSPPNRAPIKQPAVASLSAPSKPAVATNGLLPWLDAATYTKRSLSQSDSTAAVSWLNTAATSAAPVSANAASIAANVPWLNTAKQHSKAKSDPKPKPKYVLPTTIPVYWRKLIMDAAPQHKTSDPRLVAAALWTENRGWPSPKTKWRESPVGAKGPWQFMPDTWRDLGQDGDGDHHKDANNPRDAVHGAFNHFRGSAGDPLANRGWNGNAKQSFKTTVFQRNGNNLLSYAAAYNGYGAPDGTRLQNFPRRENADYVRMVYWLIATDFQTVWLPATGQFFSLAA